MYFEVNYEVHSGYGGPFLSIPVRSGPFLLVNAPVSRHFLIFYIKYFFIYYYFCIIFTMYVQLLTNPLKNYKNIVLSFGKTIEISRKILHKKCIFCVDLCKNLTFFRNQYFFFGPTQTMASRDTNMGKSYGSR